MSPGDSEPRIAAIVLAAGAASRMGRLKQLLPYRGRTLVRHAVEQAHQAGFAPIIVVVGAESDDVIAAVQGSPAVVAENSDWQLGMGSSISCGMGRLAQVAPEATAVAILLADQPLVSAKHLHGMQAVLSKDYSAVGAEYNGTLGVPALFSREIFPQLTAMPSNAGAKQLLHSLGPQVNPYPLSEAGADVDTPDDYEQLTSA